MQELHYAYCHLLVMLPLYRRLLSSYRKIMSNLFISGSQGLRADQDCVLFFDRVLYSLQFFSNFARGLRRVSFEVAKFCLVLLHYSFFGFDVVAG